MSSDSGAGRAVALLALSLLTLLATVAACSGRDRFDKVGPTTPSPAMPALPPTFLVRLSGTVSSEDGLPLDRAAITVVPYAAAPAPAPVTGTSDATGQYTVSFVGNSSATVFADHEGFERSVTSAGAAPGYSTAMRNLSLRRVIRMTAGETLRVIVPADRSCGFDDEFICRTVRIVSPRSGTLTVNALSEPAVDDATVGVTTVAQPTIPQHYPCCNPGVQVAVNGGDEVLVAVMMRWTSPGGAVRLRTALQ